MVNQAAAESDVVRTAEVVAGYCLHAISAASGLPSKAAARRLVTVIMAGLRSLV